MKFANVLFLIICIVQNTYGQKLTAFENKKIQVVYSFGDCGDGDFCVCYSINAYIDSQVFAINQWRNLQNKDYPQGMKSCCMIYKTRYDQFIVSRLTPISRITCDLFNPKFDSMESMKYPVNIYAVNSPSIFVDDPTAKSSINVRRKVDGSVYVAFNIIGSGFIINDSTDQCFGLSAPSFSHYLADDSRIPFIIFSEVKNCTVLTDAETKLFGFKPFSKQNLHFTYSDH